MVGGIDQGWSIEGFTGLSGVVANRDMDSDCQLGSYGVDMELSDRCVEVESESHAGSSRSLRPIRIASNERVAVSEP